MMRLAVYNDVEHRHFLDTYALQDSSHTDTPQNIVEKSKKDQDRFPIVILDDDGCQLIGCFCLHINRGPKEYGYEQKDAALIRGFSIDDNFKNQGYGSKALSDVFEFIDSTLKMDINHVILAVNERNIVAQKAYQNSGFWVVKRGIKGKKGKLLLMEKRRKL